MTQGVVGSSRRFLLRSVASGPVVPLSALGPRFLPTNSHEWADLHRLLDQGGADNVIIRLHPLGPVIR